MTTHEHIHTTDQLIAKGRGAWGGLGTSLQNIFGEKTVANTYLTRSCIDALVVITRNCKFVCQDCRIVQGKDQRSKIVRKKQARYKKVTYELIDLLLRDLFLLARSMAAGVKGLMLADLRLSPD